MYRESADDLGAVVTEQRFSRAVTGGVVVLALPAIALGLWMLPPAIKEARHGSPALLLGDAVILLFAISRLWGPIRWRTLRIAVHTGGITFSIPGQGDGSYRWDRLTTFNALPVGMKSRVGSRATLKLGSKLTGLALRFSDGRSVHVPREAADPAALHQALIEHATPVLLDRARAALAAGEIVDFGQLKATRRGLALSNGKEARWEDLLAARVVKQGIGAGMLELVSRNGEVLDQVIYGLVPNVPVLEALIEGPATRS